MLCLATYTGMSATETAITIIIHKNVGEALPCQNIFIALPLPAPHILGPWYSFSSHRPRCVGHLCYPFIRLLPTCIPGKLYARERSEKREKKRDVSSLLFGSDLFPVLIPRAPIHRARTCTRIFPQRVACALKDASLFRWAKQEG